MALFKISLLLIIVVSIALAGEQSVRVSGKFTCHGRPAQYVEVQLVSKAIIGGTAFARDVFTDPSGYFEIAGYIDAGWSWMDARLYVWHTCYEKPYEYKDGCLNWFDVSIPNMYLSTGPLAQKAWNMGQVALEIPKKGQSEVCE